MDETLETAAFRNWAVAVKTKPGAKKRIDQMFVVKAHSLAKAREEAWKRIIKGQFKYSPRNYFVMEIEEMKNDDGNAIPAGDSEGTRRADEETL